jgi:hypothetical protein
MIVKLRTNQTTQHADPLAPDALAAPFIGNKPAEFLSELTRETEPDISRRRLRNRFILANAIVWIVVIVAVRLIFF